MDPTFAVMNRNSVIINPCELNGKIFVNVVFFCFASLQCCKILLNLDEIERINNIGCQQYYD